MLSISWSLRQFPEKHFLKYSGTRGTERTGGVTVGRWWRHNISLLDAIVHITAVLIWVYSGFEKATPRWSFSRHGFHVGVDEVSCPSSPELKDLLRDVLYPITISSFTNSKPPSSESSTSLPSPLFLTFLRSQRQKMWEKGEIICLPKDAAVFCLCSRFRPIYS